MDTPRDVVNPSFLPPAMVVLLFVSWVEALASEKLGGGRGWRSQREGRSYTFSAGDDRRFVLSIDLMPSDPPWQVSIDSMFGVDSAQVLEIVEEAEKRTASRQLGNPRAYRTEFTTKTFDLFADWVHWGRGIFDYVPIQGAHRLHTSALLEFGDLDTPEDSDEFSLFVGAGPQSIKATVFVQAPSAGEYAHCVAATVTEVVAAVCTFATGVPVTYRAERMVALSDEETLAALKRQSDASIPTLTRIHRSPGIADALVEELVSLDIFGDLVELGGYEDAQARVRGALVAYQAALTQTVPDVAVILFVTAIEALIAPRGAWGKRSVTKRFTESLIELCPATVDAILAQEDVEEAFPYRKRGGLHRQRKELLEAIYECRCRPTHSGFELSRGPWEMMIEDYRVRRIALLALLCRAAIVAYVQRPRSSTVGFWTSTAAE